MTQALRLAAGALLSVAAMLLAASSCDSALFYDEGARFSNELSDFADSFQQSAQQEAVFVYTPKYGVDQDYSVELSAGHACPNPPCADPSSMATVDVAKGRSGNGYSCGRHVSVPETLSIKAHGAPVSVSLRKRDGIVEAIGIK